MNITATVCIYSGRRNPQWEVPLKEYNKLLLHIKKMEDTEPVPLPQLLGYTGIIITRGKTTITLYNETITLAEEGTVKGYTDAGRILERKVLHEAPPEIFNDIRTMLPQELW